MDGGPLKLVVSSRRLKHARAFFLVAVAGSMLLLKAFERDTSGVNAGVVRR